MTDTDKVDRFKTLKEKVEETSKTVTELNASVNTLKDEESKILQALKEQFGIENEDQLRARIQELYAEIDGLNDQAETVLKNLNEKVQKEQERIQNADAPTQEEST
jgi:uncharacterized protein YoxC